MLKVDQTEDLASVISAFETPFKLLHSLVSSHQQGVRGYTSSFPFGTALFSSMVLKVVLNIGFLYHYTLSIYLPYISQFYSSLNRHEFSTFIIITTVSYYRRET
jgi:hypothetical protein